MPLPIFRKQDAPQVGMSVENHSEQVVSFAFVPVGCPPHTRDCGNAWIVFGQLNFQPQPVKLRGREQVIVHFEPRLFFYATVSATNISQKIEFGFRVSFQACAQFDDVFSRNNRRDLGVGLHDLRNPF